LVPLFCLHVQDAGHHDVVALRKQAGGETMGTRLSADSVGQAGTSTGILRGFDDNAWIHSQYDCSSVELTPEEGLAT